MLFPTTVFALFFLAVFSLYNLFRGRPLARKTVLLCASLFFYCYWHTGFAVMLVLSAAANYFFSAAIARSGNNGGRRRLLLLSVGANLLLLAVFKYTAFFFGEIFIPAAVPLFKIFGRSDLLVRFNERTMPIVQSIVLPVGISFYTFQAIGYLVDVAKGKHPPAKSCLDFVNYLAFFPKLAAGPIVRAGQILPQMENPPERCGDFPKALVLVLAGLFKKTVIANWLSTYVADPFFQFPEDYGTVDAIMASYGYAIQIYCDFSAYSDIATGTALLLGFDFPCNFNAPYFAQSVRDFWRRWHITLSGWLRDYLYIPMGGSRAAKAKIYRNLFLTMLLGGLWHGAGWCYVIWGCIHGLVQIFERAAAFGQKDGIPKAPVHARFIKAFITFNIVTFAWIFFRSGAGDTEGFATAMEALKAFSRISTPAKLFSPMVLLFLLAGFLTQLLDGDGAEKIAAKLRRANPVLQGLAGAAILSAILGLGPAGVAPFIYFQF